MATVFDRILLGDVIGKALDLYCLVLRHVDTLPRPYRRGISVIGSLVLHLGLLLLLLPATTGLASLGSTGVGNVEGAGTAVTLVDAAELILPKASQTEAETTVPEQTPETAATPDTAEAVEDKAEQTQTVNATTQAETTPTTQIAYSGSDVPSEDTAQAAAGAHGQNGKANTDLWNAIAPCWNRIAAKDTLSATLTISFTEDGGLSIPPVIDRDPDAPITDQSLQSEAKALAALAECGAYPMVKGQQNVKVVFPAPTTMVSAK